ncbi:hypothetical protein CLAIMM_09578 [Cladophialophora immunda]|nr:hypothetical protein CLAIMM_09578 [Cladophialophora immunda]
MVPCRFFARGNCARGSECRFDHSQSLRRHHEPGTRTSLRADAPEFQVTSSPKPVCKFYNRGTCRNGSECPYLHPAHSHSSVNRAASRAETQVLPLARDPLPVERFLKGVRVRFGEGSQILDVKFPSDEPGVHGNPPITKVQVSTVFCSWYNPSRIVWLHYRSSLWATNASKRFEKRLHGRQIRVKIQPPSRHHGRPKSIWSLQLNNVFAETTKKDLQEHLKGVEPDDIVFGALTSRKTQQEAVDWVKARLTESGRKLRSFNFEPNTTGSRMKAFACFDSPSVARAVVALAQANFPDLGSKLFVELVAAVSIPVLRELHSILKDKLEELQAHNKYDVRISVYDHREVKLVMLRIYGPRPQAVAHVKTKLGEMLTGTVVLDDSGSALWHDFFSTDEGLSCLKSVSQNGKVFVHRDLRKQQLQLYGFETLFEDARRAIIQRLASHSSVHLIALEGELFATALSGGFRRLVRKFGKQNAKLDVLQKPPAIIFRGSPRDCELARSLILERHHPEAKCPQANSSQECTCCFSSADDPVKLDCGHTYCRCCFDGLCEEVKHNRVPIVCFGDRSDCGQIVPLNELKKLLDHHRFEAVLEASFDATYDPIQIRCNIVPLRIVRPSIRSLTHPPCSHVLIA